MSCHVMSLRRTRPGPGRNLGQSKTTLNHENTTNP